ncbi:MAG: methionine adenosyltransferase [Thermoproteota archaeon]
MIQVVVDEINRTPLEKQKIEICERKGLGHPDYICDSIMNEVSVALSKEYMRRYESILHHNIDKGLLVAGEAKVRFGGGKIEKPMLLIFGDRATISVGDTRIDIEKIAIEAAKNWFRRNLRFVDPDEHLNYQVELKPGAEELRDIFQRGGRFLGANDTSAAVGYAPMTKTEKLVLETERFLNSRSFKKEYPETGEDVKVMGLRKGDHLTFTIAMSFIDRYVKSETDYFRKKSAVIEEIRNFMKSKTSLKTEIYLNTLDKKGRGVNGVYLTVLGTSAEAGDSGQVGRGNRVNGIIPLNRPTSSEAAAGKNPISHVGKIYNVLTYYIADSIYKKVSGIEEIYVWLLSQIGQPIDRPKIVASQIIPSSKGTFHELSRDVEEALKAELDCKMLKKFCQNLAEGRLPVC